MEEPLNPKEKLLVSLKESSGSQTVDSTFFEGKMEDYQESCLNTNKSLNELRIKDILWIVDNRKLYAMGLFGFVVIQYGLIAGFIVWAICNNKIEKITVILSILVTGIFLETAYLVKIIIQWLFSPIDFGHIKLASKDKDN
jgi:uncharacterized membrane protein YdbT with pleckstrin-like domain